MIKMQVDGTGIGLCMITKRDGYNRKNDYLYANESNAERDSSHIIDMLSMVLNVEQTQIQIQMVEHTSIWHLQKNL